LETAGKDNTFYPSILVGQYERKQKDKAQTLLPQRNLVPSHRKQKVLITFFDCKGVAHEVCYTMYIRAFDIIALSCGQQGSGSA
jgi:hypothetical protein